MVNGGREEKNVSAAWTMVELAAVEPHRDVFLLANTPGAGARDGDCSMRLPLQRTTCSTQNLWRHVNCTVFTITYCYIFVLPFSVMIPDATLNIPDTTFRI
jgi:hypothetical protein